MRKCPICETVYHAVVGAQATCPKGHGYWQQMEKIGLAKIKGGDQMGGIWGLITFLPKAMIETAKYVHEEEEEDLTPAQGRFVKKVATTAVVIFFVLLLIMATQRQQIKERKAGY